MRFLLDESTDPRLADYLRLEGHDATTIAIDYPASLADQHVLPLARTERRSLLTNDRDFGELVFAHHQAHSGVIFLRLEPQTITAKIARLAPGLTHDAAQLDQFLVVTKERVRVRPSVQPPDTA